MGGEGREEWGLVSTLTRARGRATVARLAPLEDYLGPGEEGRGARYSTIGRARAREGVTAPSPPPCCPEGEERLAGHRLNPPDLYY